MSEPGGRTSTPAGRLAREVAVALRERVRPMLGTLEGRAHAGRARAGDSRPGDRGGDVTFAIDAAAERFLEQHLARIAPGTAFYSEDRGLVAPRESCPKPSTVLVVDPIDGTRPALAGLESCCVSVAAAPLRDGVTIGDVSAGCVAEIPSGRVFCAERGRGLTEGPPVRLSRVDSVDRMFWAYGFRGRPARPMAEVLGGLIDSSSVGGGTFELGSAAFDMTRVITGQLDAYVEPGPRLVAEVAGMRDEFERVGSGALLNNSPYDVAASALCLAEAGAVVTDARGAPIEDRPLLGSGAEHQLSVVAAANEALHRRILLELDAGIERLAALREGGERACGLV